MSDYNRTIVGSFLQVHSQHVILIYDIAHSYIVNALDEGVTSMNLPSCGLVGLCVMRNRRQSYVISTGARRFILRLGEKRLVLFLKK